MVGSRSLKPGGAGAGLATSLPLVADEVKSMATRWQLDGNSTADLPSSCHHDGNAMATRCKICHRVATGLPSSCHRMAIMMAIGWQLWASRGQPDRNSNANGWQLDGNSMATRWQICHRLAIELPSSCHRVAVGLPSSYHRVAIQLPSSCHRLGLRPNQALAINARRAARSAGGTSTTAARPASFRQSGAPW